jgi:uncharacterized protein DUF6982
MSDPVHTASERGLLGEPQLSNSGFDVNAAAAEVHAELTPDGPPAGQRWTAADYGWDPEDANAIAWAAYYSDLGVDPVALAAQQAAEAAAQAAPAEEEPAAVELGAEVPLQDQQAPQPEAELAPEPAACEALAPDEPAAELGAPRGLEDSAATSDDAASRIVDVEPVAPLLAGDDPLAGDLSFSPIPEQGPDAGADVAPGFVDGGSAIWELLPTEAALAATPSTDAPLPHELPSGWHADDRARLDDFQLASGGSFDEATAPIGDLFQPADAVEPLSPELPPLDAGDALGEQLAPGAPAGAEPAPHADPLDVSEPLALPALDLAAPDAELSIDLGFLEDEPAEPPPAGAGAPPAAPSFDLDLQAPPTSGLAAELFSGALEPEPAPAAESPLDLDLGWASHAVPAGDAAVDLATFDAEPQLDAEGTTLGHEPQLEDTRAPEGTAMWGLPARATVTSAPARELLGDAEPLPTPAPLLASAELGEPVDGALFLEPVGDADAESARAAQPDPWNVSAPAAAPLDPAPGSGAEPLDRGLGSAGPAAETSEDILEVGEEVVEVAVVEPEPEPSAPSPAEAAPPPAVEEPLPGAELLAAFAAVPAPVAPAAPVASAPPVALVPTVASVPPVAPAPAAPAAPPACFIAGSHRVVVHTSDGQVKRGTLCDAALDGPELRLVPQTGSAPEPLPADRVKAIFFMLAAGEPPPAPEGKKVRVTFRDGRQVAGFSPDYAPERVGFFMVPVDTRTHTARIWVYRASVRQVTVSP